jgi:serine/threonine protein kinase
LLGPGAETDSGDGRSRFSPPEVDALQALFPRLEIASLLGVGGMGAVYRARQADLDRWVALKILPADHRKGTGFVERFNREARALARLSHPNIVAVYEFGEVTDLHYFLMELVEGANLRQLQRSGRVSAREVLQIIPQICDALQYAHDQGVVHRDIKPENVLVDRRGKVKIADFGLARMLGTAPEGDRLTAEGQVMGTPHYMAPEQLDRPALADHRADIFSLGVVFYELLTGELPLGRFAPPSSKRLTVDVRLDAIVLRALENDPERRYQRASEVKSGVESVLDQPAGSEKGRVGGAGGRAEPEREPGRPDWREWIPFQSAEVKDVYRHYTPEERRAEVRMGLGFLLPFLSFSLAVNLAFGWLHQLRHPGLAAGLALVYAVVAAVSIERATVRARLFICSTQWAKRRGLRPEQLRMYSLHPWEPVDSRHSTPPSQDSSGP